MTVSGDAPLDWPPKRFLEGLEWCEKFRLRPKFDRLDFLRSLHDKAIFLRTGRRDGPLDLNAFLVGLSSVLASFTESDRDYKALEQARGEAEASIDLATGVYVLMLNNQVVTLPLTM